MHTKKAINIADSIIVLYRKTEAVIKHQFPGKEVHRLANPLDSDSIEYSQRRNRNDADDGDRRAKARPKAGFCWARC